MKHITISLLGILFFLSGCGDRHIHEKNCIPPVTYVSTENARFITYQLIDQSQWHSFDTLQVSKRNEWLLEIVGTGEQTIVDFAGNAVLVEEYPPNTVLSLTGESITRSPYGFATAFYSDMTYLKGKIDKKTIWIPTFYLSELNKDSVEENIASNKILGLETFKYDWKCINK